MLAALPVLFGFHPRQSLVVVSLEGPQLRMGPAMRIDLPPGEHAEPIACQVADTLRRHAVRAVLLVAYSDDPGLADPIVDACRDRLVLDRVSVVEAVRCDDSRYWSYQCHDPDCCPPTGTPYDASTSPVLAEAVLAGLEVLPDRAAVRERLAPVTGAARDAVVAACEAEAAELAKIMAAAPPGRRQQVVVEAGAARVKPILAKAVAAPGEPLSDAEVAQLSVWCSLILVRDVAWAQISRANAAASFAVWAQVARRVVPPFEPAVLCLTAFAAWMKGDGASAWCAVERAEAVDPGYSMMQLLRDILAAAISPVGWPQLDEAEVWAALRQH